MHECGAASQGPGSQPAAPRPTVKASTSCSEQQCAQQGCGGDAALAAAAPPAAAAPSPGTTCMKCQQQQAQVLARGREPLCWPCLHEQLLGKVRNAVRLHSLILPKDRLALAFSGGRGSAALLHLLAELRSARTDRPERGKVAFTLRIIHVDESAADPGLGEAAAAAWRASVAAAAAPYCCEGVQYSCVPVEAVFDDDGEAAAAPQGDSCRPQSGAATAPAPSQQRDQARSRLHVLLAAVRDATGREDLLRHLRTRALLHAAAGAGCTRLARGDSATALATHIVAAASKGCGYSLPGDVRLVDARHGAALPPVFLPLREVSARELAALCGHLALPLAAPPAGTAAPRAAGATINSLAAAFVAGMEAHNTGSVHNMLSAVAKLEAFPWNDPPPAAQGKGQRGRQQAQGEQQQQQQQQQQQEQQEQGPGERAAAAAVLCPICWAPLAPDELPGSSGGSSEHTSGGTGAVAAATTAGCCLSCHGQILSAGGPAGSSEVAAALPAAVRRRMAALSAAGARAAAGADAAGGVERLRSQIADFLLE